MTFGIILAVLLIVIDQIAKLFTIGFIDPTRPITIIPNILEFHYIENDSAAWGLFGSIQWVFFPVTILALAAFSYLLYRAVVKKEKTLFYAFILLIAGTLGNAIDRFAYAENGFFNGPVIDTFHIPFLDYILGNANFIFNLADLFLTTGIILYGIDLLFLEQRRKNKNDNNKD